MATIPSRRLNDLARALGLLWLGGCATLQNTPLQDYVWEIGRQCNAAGITMTRVEPDGRYYLQGTNVTSFAAFQDCMKEQQQKQPYQAWLAKNNKPGVTPSGPTPANQAANPVAVAVPAATDAPGAVPVWRQGDQWEYRWSSPSGSGSYVLAVDREETVGSDVYYVLKAGSMSETYYRKTDLVPGMQKIEANSQSEYVPSTSYVQWPLVPGATWEVRFTGKRPPEQQTADTTLRCVAEPATTITVPAGAFETVPFTCRDAATGRVVVESWPSSAVRQVVRERAHLQEGVRQRELIGVKPAP